MDKIRFISPALHGLIDYAVAVLLIVAPFAIPITDHLGMYLSVVAGAGLLVYSLLTDYSRGLRKMIPFKAHLALDFLAGVVFIVFPFWRGYAGLQGDYFLVIGIAVVLVVLLTRTDQPTGA